MDGGLVSFVVCVCACVCVSVCVQGRPARANRKITPGKRRPRLDRLDVNSFGNGQVWGLPWGLPLPGAGEEQIYC